MSKAIHCGRSMQPFDIMEAWVEIDEDEGLTIVPTDRGVSLNYEPTGYTEPIWDSQYTIGYGCQECGLVTLVVEEIVLGNTIFRRVP